MWQAICTAPKSLCRMYLYCCCFMKVGSPSPQFDYFNPTVSVFAWVLSNFDPFCPSDFSFKLAPDSPLAPSLSLHCTVKETFAACPSALVVNTVVFVSWLYVFLDENKTKTDCVFYWKCVNGCKSGLHLHCIKGVLTASASVHKTLNWRSAQQEML